MGGMENSEIYKTMNRQKWNIPDIRINGCMNGTIDMLIVMQPNIKYSSTRPNLLWPF